MWSGVPPSHKNNPRGIIHHFCDHLLERPLVIVSSDNDDDNAESEHNLEKCIFVFMRNIDFALCCQPVCLPSGVSVGQMSEQWDAFDS